MQYCKLKGMALSTIANKSKYLNTTFQQIQVDIKPLDLERYLLYKYKDQTPKSFNNRVSDLRAFYNYLIRYELYDKNPALGIEFKKVVFKAQRVFSDDEVRKIIDCPRGYQRSRKEHSMYSLLFELYALTGIRRSEGIKLLIEDVIDDKAYPYIILRETKNGDDRLLPIPHYFIQKLLVYIKEVKPVTYVFEGRKGKKLSKGAVTKAFERRLKCLKLYSPHVGIHALRRAKISRLLMNHADLIGVQKLAGHKKMDTTIRYLYVNMKYLQEQAEKDPLFSKSGLG